MGLESHGICVPGHESRDLGLILLGRLGLGQISLGQSRDKNLWDSQIPSFGTTWASSPMGFLSPMGPIWISWDSFSMGFRVPQVVRDEVAPRGRHWDPNPKFWDWDRCFRILGLGLGSIFQNFVIWIGIGIDFSEVWDWDWDRFFKIL